MPEKISRRDILKWAAGAVGIGAAGLAGNEARKALEKLAAKGVTIQDAEAESIPVEQPAQIRHHSSAKSPESPGKATPEPPNMTESRTQTVLSMEKRMQAESLESANLLPSLQTMRFGEKDIGWSEESSLAKMYDTKNPHNYIEGKVNGRVLFRIFPNVTANKHEIVYDIQLCDAEDFITDVPTLLPPNTFTARNISPTDVKMVLNDMVEKLEKVRAMNLVNVDDLISKTIEAFDIYEPHEQ